MTKIISTYGEVTVFSSTGILTAPLVVKVGVRVQIWKTIRNVGESIIELYSRVDKRIPFAHEAEKSNGLFAIVKTEHEIHQKADNTAYYLGMYYKKFSKV